MEGTVAENLSSSFNGTLNGTLNATLGNESFGRGHIDPNIEGAIPVSVSGKKLSVQKLDSDFSRLAGHRSREGFERDKMQMDQPLGSSGPPLPTSLPSGLSSTMRVRQQSSPPLTPGGGSRGSTPVHRSLGRGSLVPHTSPEEMFPNDDALQELERKDREWLSYRNAERLRQEKEDLAAYESRLEARKKSHYVTTRAQTHSKEHDSERPLITEEDRKNFRILVGIDKKKAKEHATGLVVTTYMCSHQSNKVYLYNCYKKKSAKRQPETEAHLKTIREQLLKLRGGMSIDVSCENTTKEKAVALVDKAHDACVDLIVLGMKAEDKTFFVRKVSPGVIDSCPEGKAVLLVPPPDANPRNPDRGRIILFCYDGTPHCERSLVYLAHLIKKEDKVVVCTVVTPAPKLVVVAQSDDRASLQPNVNYEAILSQRVQTAEKQVERVKNQLVDTLAPEYATAENIDTELRIVDPGKATVADIIMEVAKHLNADLIVLGSRGIDCWQKVVQGAVTQSILQTAAKRSILIAR
eukprot:TRINITY_DN4061_c2_g1_i1.p1 TRINITY_DN4061_c2_g1~~TRINITY_DN4061_c2_g1_i1.p1  ORF type:complete len:535 (+),score=194.35 TRINITY_DN4061_c2_g1_i1:40-1605(+)